MLLHHQIVAKRRGTPLANFLLTLVFNSRCTISAQIQSWAACKILFYIIGLTKLDLFTNKRISLKHFNFFYRRNTLDSFRTSELIFFSDSKIILKAWPKKSFKIVFWLSKNVTNLLKHLNGNRTRNNKKKLDNKYIKDINKWNKWHKTYLNYKKRRQTSKKSRPSIYHTLNIYLNIKDHWFNNGVENTTFL